MEPHSPTRPEDLKSPTARCVGSIPTPGTWLGCGGLFFRDYADAARFSRNTLGCRAATRSNANAGPPGVFPVAQCVDTDSERVRELLLREAGE